MSEYGQIIETFKYKGINGFFLVINQLFDKFFVSDTGFGACNPCSGVGFLCV